MVTSYAWADKASIPEVMSDSSKMKEDMEKWMLENKVRFDMQPEV
ncbi:MAG: hypothetical protein Q8Q18_02455 [bacterium]|nr:hypothetical protein [bacterium]